MNWRAIRHEFIFETQLNISVAILRFLGNTKKCKHLMQIMASLPENTLGKHLHHLMKTKNLELVPWYEDHDMKHALLGYKMEATEEMKMQAFMFGNAGFPVFITIVTFFFMIWTPEMWADFKYHYNIGKLVKPLKDWTLEKYMYQDLLELRQEIGLQKAIETVKKIQNENK